MGEYSEAFVALDVAKTKRAVAIADGGHGGEVRFLGGVANSPAAVERLIGKLAGRYGKLHFCYEPGPTGRQIQTLASDLRAVSSLGNNPLGVSITGVGTAGCHGERDHPTMAGCRR